MNSILLEDLTVTPSKIICIGRNYVEHIEELGNEMPTDMVVFNKPSSAISKDLHSHHLDHALHYEAELCLLMNNGQVSAVGLGFDLTKRELQGQLKTKGLPWERAKAFDGAACFSKFIPLSVSIEELRYQLFIDGELTQSGDPNKMIFPVEKMLEELQAFMSLTDGDIIMTGTPKGVGVVKAGAQYLVKLSVQDQVLIEHSWIAR